MHTDIHASNGIQTLDSSVRASEDSSCLTPRGRCDRHFIIHRYLKTLNVYVHEQRRKTHAVNWLIKWVLYYRNRCVLTGFKLFRKETSDGLLWIIQWTFDFYSWRWVSWQTERVLSFCRKTLFHSSSSSVNNLAHIVDRTDADWLWNENVVLEFQQTSPIRRTD
jgi:hypothetical protein